MRFVEYSPPSTAGHLALDEALLNLREDEPGDGFLRFWEPRELSVVLGRTNNAATEVRLDRCRQRGVPVFRRSSGGGTVVQGPGCLNFSLVANIAAEPMFGSAGSSNEYVLRRHASVISLMTGKAAAVSGSSDLTIDGRKFSGNSQRRRLRTVLYHGCVLLDFDFTLIEDLLPLPSRQPAYRAGRSHTEFLRNLRIDPDTLKGTLRAAWGASLTASDVPVAETERLVREKYTDPGWTYK